MTEKKNIQNTTHQLLFLFNSNEILFVKFSLLMEDDSLFACGLIPILCTTKAGPDVTTGWYKKVSGRGRGPEMGFRDLFGNPTQAIV